MSSHSQISISVSDDEEDFFLVSWVFFDESCPNCKPCLADIPSDLFKMGSSECRDLFVNDLLKEFKFKADKYEICFFKPKRPLLSATVVSHSPMWMEGIDKDTFRSLFEPIPLTLSLEKAFHSEEEAEEDTIHLIVTTVGTYVDPRRERLRNRTEDRDEVQRYYNLVKQPGQTPSTGAESTQYAVTQGLKYELIHDGRYPPSPEIPTVAPPIELFSPTFGNFTRRVNDSSYQPDNKYLSDVQEFMKKLSVIGTPDGQTSESARNAFIRANLQILWGLEIRNEENQDGTKADGVHSVFLNGRTTVNIMVMELQTELGEGGCDPSTQAGLSMRRAWIQDNRTEIRDKCCCPTLMIVGGGPWFGVLGGVLTDRIIVQRLTDMMWVGHSSTHDNLRVYRFARLLNAIKECILELEDFYKVITQNKYIPLKPCGTSPRFYPYPKTFRENGQTVVFKYMKKLKPHAGCVTYKAKTTGGEDIIVRFVSRYGKDVHEFLAGDGLAPRLRYCGPLSGKLGDKDEDEAPPPPHASTGLWLGPMRMVVMDYITSLDKPPTDAFEQLEQVLGLLHPAGYVLGNLQLQNVLFDEDGGVKIIDFDWSGRFDMSIQDEELPDGIQKKINDNKALVTQANDNYARYPLNTSKAVRRTPGVSDLAPIRPQHDWIMLKTMKPYL